MFKRVLSKFVLWAVVPRKYKQCRGFCLRCPHYDTCREEMRAAMGLGD